MWKPGSWSAAVVKTEIPFTYIAKGKYWRFRRNGHDTKLPGKPGDAEFHQAYARLMASTEPKPKASRQSFAWLIKRYRESAEFNALAERTQDDYSDTLDLIDKEMGDQPYALTTRAMIKAVRDDYSKTPRKAHKIKQMVSRLYSWADEEELVPAGFNPASGLKKIKAKVKPITPWSEEEISLFLARCEPFMRTPVMLALYTGQRREDVVNMTWKDYQERFIRVKQSKTGEPLDIACHPTLRDHLDAIKTRFDGKIARTADGKPFNANSLSAALNRAVESIAGMPHRTLHGLRYAAAARMEEAGCTIVEITSVLGHRTYQMGMKYAAQRRASESALAKQEKRA